MKENDISNSQRYRLSKQSLVYFMSEITTTVLDRVLHLHLLLSLRLGLNIAQAVLKLAMQLRMTLNADLPKS